MNLMAANGRRNNRDKILILGADGYLGTHLFTELGPQRAVATCYLREINHGHYFDALSMNLSEVVQAPESISHAVILYGDTKPDSCAVDPEKSHSLNVDSTKTVVDWLTEHGVKVVFTSTESVFDGEKGDYTEKDAACPIHAYGRQKLEVESYIQTRDENHIIIRLGRILGTTPGDGTLLDGFIKSIDQKQTIYCAHDQIFSPVYVSDVVSGIIKLIEQNCSGLFHLCNPVAYSRLQILEQMIASLGKSSPVEAYVVPCKISDLGLAARRPLNISMIPYKLIGATGMELTSLEQICDKMAANAFPLRNNTELSE